MADFLNIVAVGILLGGIYALVSVGLNLIFGVIRIVNFAQGEFVMLGMYGACAAYSVLGLDPYTAVLLVVPGLFVLGAAVQKFLLAPLRSEPSMQIFATFGLLLLLQNVILALTRGAAYSVATPAAQVSIAIGPVQIGLVRLIVLVAATAVAVALGAFLQRTMLGRAIRAVAQDYRAATLMGVNVERIYMVSFGIGAALAGLAGCLLTPIYSMSPQIGANFILPAFAVVVLGGLGSVLGAYVGGFIVGLTEALAGYYLDPALKHAVLFAVFILVLVVRPSGLFGQAGSEEVGFVRSPSSPAVAMVAETPTRPPVAAATVKTFVQDLPPMAVVLALLAGLIYAASGDSFTLNILSTALLFAGLASAWNLIGGLGGQFSLGHSVYFAVGAYVTANLYSRAGISPWFGLIPAAGLAALVAVLVSWPVFRLRGPFFAIATMASTEVALALCNYFDSFTGGTRGMSIPFRLGFANMIFRDRLSYAMLMYGFAALCLVIALAVTRSRLGYYLQAVRDNEQTPWPRGSA